MFEILLFFILAVIIGLMLTFFGYPFFRVLLPFWAFFAGLMIGFKSIAGWLGASFMSASLGLLLGVLIGAVLALIAYLVYSVAIYLYGLTLGFVLGAGLIYALGLGMGFLSFLFGIGVAILFAWLFSVTQMPRFLIILSTAAGGAMAVITGLLVLFGRVPTILASLELTRYMVSGSFFWALVWIALTVLGIVFQYTIVSSYEEMYKEYDWNKGYPKHPKVGQPAHQH